MLFFLILKMYRIVEKKKMHAQIKQFSTEHYHIYVYHIHLSSIYVQCVNRCVYYLIIPTWNVHLTKDGFFFIYTL